MTNIERDYRPVEQEPSEKQLLVLFGIPGVGKNYAGQVLEEEYGYYFHDGDTNFTPEIAEAVAKGEPVTDAMREVYIPLMFQAVAEALETHPRVVVGNVLMQNKHRRMMQEAFPYARFIQITTDESTRRERIMQRTGHSIAPARALDASKMFEPPEEAGIPYDIVHNVGGREELSYQLQQLLNRYAQEDLANTRGFGSPIPPSSLR